MIEYKKYETPLLAACELVSNYCAPTGGEGDGQQVAHVQGLKKLIQEHLDGWTEGWSWKKEFDAAIKALAEASVKMADEFLKRELSLA